MPDQPRGNTLRVPDIASVAVVPIPIDDEDDESVVAIVDLLG
jgi:hypothetical protein